MCQISQHPARSLHICLNTCTLNFVPSFLVPFSSALNLYFAYFENWGGGSSPRIK